MSFFAGDNLRAITSGRWLQRPADGDEFQVVRRAEGAQLAVEPLHVVGSERRARPSATATCAARSPDVPVEQRTTGSEGVDTSRILSMPPPTT